MWADEDKMGEPAPDSLTHSVLPSYLTINYFNDKYENKKVVHEIRGQQSNKLRRRN